MKARQKEALKADCYIYQRKKLNCPEQDSNQQSLSYMTAFQPTKTARQAIMYSSIEQRGYRERCANMLGLSTCSLFSPFAKQTYLPPCEHTSIYTQASHIFPRVCIFTHMSNAHTVRYTHKKSSWLARQRHGQCTQCHIHTQKYSWLAGQIYSLLPSNQHIYM